MPSKTSYFNKTIFFKNITHYWPVWTAYLLYTLFVLPLLLYLNLTTRNVIEDSTFNLELFQITLLQETIENSLHPFVFFLFACITAIAVFSYLFQARSANMIHALPVCRKSLFITNGLSGLSFLLVPQLLAFLISIFVCLGLGITNGAVYLLHWLVLSGGMVIFAFALAVFIVMITGNILAVPAFYVIVNFLFIGGKTLIGELIEQLSYGIRRSFSFSSGDFLSPYYFLSNHLGGYSLFSSDTMETFPKEAYGYIGGYFIAAIFLFLIAYILYEKKQLETTGDFIAVSFLKPFFRWGATIFLSIGVTLFVYALFAIDSRVATPFLLIIILFIISGTIVFFLAEMLIQKNFRVFSKRKFTECGAALALLLALVSGIEFDVFGLETAVPKTEDIVSIYFSNSYNLDVAEEDFSKIVSIHQSLIDSKKEFETYFDTYNEDYSTPYISIDYTLKNNKTLSRRYYIPITDAYLENENSAFFQACALENNTEYYMKHHFSDTYDNITFIEGSLTASINETDDFTLNQEQCIQFYEAFQKDVAEGNYRIYHYALEERISDRIYYNRIYLSFQTPELTDETYTSAVVETQDKASIITLEETSYAQQGTSITLTTDCVHSIQALTEMGFINEEHTLMTQKEADIFFSEDNYLDK